MRSHLPWSLRWAVAVVALGFSAAMALWAFEFGKSIAGMHRGAQDALAGLRAEVVLLKTEHAKSRRIADTAESLPKAEQVTRQRLAQQLRQAEADKQALQADPGFFERLLPTAGDGMQLRDLQAEARVPGQLRYQMLVVQNGRTASEFKGHCELLLSGQLEGKPWSQALNGGPQPLQLRQYTRLEGTVEHPPVAVIKTVQARVMDLQGVTRATQSVRPIL